jgi:phosphotransferase system HPr-like phosphotransfer protein
MTREVTVLLDSIDKVNHFVNTLAQFNQDVDLARGKYVVDAKSIMGIFTMDLSKPVTLRTNANEKAANEIFESVRQYVVA